MTSDRIQCYKEKKRAINILESGEYITKEAAAYAKGVLLDDVLQELELEVKKDEKNMCRGCN